MKTLPALLKWAMSPERNQPSEVNAALVASGLLKYSFMMFGPKEQRLARPSAQQGEAHDSPFTQSSPGSSIPNFFPSGLMITACMFGNSRPELPSMSISPA